MPSVSPIKAPQHILELLSQLHKRSLEQEAAMSKTGKVAIPDIQRDLKAKSPHCDLEDAFDELMIDKFIALDEDKCQFVHQLINAIGATHVVEAGTSFGVSTIYLALAVAQTTDATGKEGKVIATEKEPSKAAAARSYWKQCGELVEKQIDLREGDLLETLKQDVPVVDLLLLDSKFLISHNYECALIIAGHRGTAYYACFDIPVQKMSNVYCPVWSALALPTLKTIQSRLRHGAVVLTDNVISGAAGYRDLLEYLRTPENEFQNLTLPFRDGLEMSVYLPSLNHG